MDYYEIAVLKLKISKLSEVGEKIKEFVSSTEAKGTLLGAWYTDVGQLNEVYILRGYKTELELITERKRVRLSSNPFNCAALLDNMQLDSYIPFDFVEPVIAGPLGPIYEIRTYYSKVNGLAPTIENWRTAVPNRTKYSNLSMLMYAIDGKSRFTHIWSYQSVEERAKVRAQVVADGVWPPNGAADCLTSEMTSTLLFRWIFHH